MLASEAHWLGEPCYHVVQFYELNRQRRIAANILKAARANRRRRIREV